MVRQQLARRPHMRSPKGQHLRSSDPERLAGQLIKRVKAKGWVPVRQWAQGLVCRGSLFLIWNFQCLRSLPDAVPPTAVGAASCRSDVRHGTLQGIVHEQRGTAAALGARSSGPRLSCWSENPAKQGVACDRAAEVLLAFPIQFHQQRVQHQPQHSPLPCCR